jgi:hypothetical protein
LASFAAVEKYISQCRIVQQRLEHSIIVLFFSNNEEKLREDNKKHEGSNQDGVVGLNIVNFPFLTTLTSHRDSQTAHQQYTSVNDQLIKTRKNMFVVQKSGFRVTQNNDDSSEETSLFLQQCE